MVSGIRFFSSSGVLGDTVASLYAQGRATPRLEIFNLEDVAAETTVPNRLGFFGAAGAPNSPIIVGQYNVRAHVTDYLGNDYGQLIGATFTGSSSISMSGEPWLLTFADIPVISGTVLARFTEPNGTNVETQNCVLRAVDLDANHIAQDVTASTVTNATIYAAELANSEGNSNDSAWTQLSDGAGGGSDLTLSAQTVEAVVHDFHILVSLSPGQAGRKTDFALYVQLEFL